jgi:hypothetical protein
VAGISEIEVAENFDCPFIKRTFRSSGRIGT